MEKDKSLYNTIEPYADWLVTTNRFVAFLDMFEFNQMTARNNHDDIYDILKRITTVKDKLSSLRFNNINSYFHITIFSNNIIIFSKDDRDYPTQYFFAAVALIFNSVLEQSIPIKGTIAHGNMTVNIGSSIFFGQPLIDAYEQQKSQYFYGITLHSTAEKQTKLVKYETHFLNMKSIFQYGNVQCGNIDHYLYLNQNNHNLFDEIMAKIKYSVSGESRKYVDNTIEMFSRYRQCRYNRTKKED